jgi:hypothetical protein
LEITVTKNPNDTVMLAGHRIGIIVDSPTHGLRVITVDAEDYPRVAGYRWWVQRNRHVFYAMTSHRDDGDRATVRMHRILMPDAPEIDHRDRDGLNNVRSNLRVTTRRDNLINRRSWGVSSYRGVTRQNGRWKAQIGFGGKSHHLGLFDKPEHAAHAFNGAAGLLGYPDSSLNANLPPLTDEESIGAGIRRFEARIDALSGI